MNIKILPSLADVHAARQMISGAAIRTPLVRLNDTSSQAEIYLKLENLQPIGSFKIRGAANAIGHLTSAALAKGVLTASAGNMAQGVAWRAQMLGIPCTVIAPETAPETKIKAIERLGGRVIKVPFENWWKAFEDRAYAGVEGSKAKAEWPATRVVDSDIGPSLGCRELVRIIEVDPETRRGVLARNSVNCSSHDIHRYVWQVRSQSIAIQCGAICV